MKYSWNGHKDRSRHKNGIERSEQAGLVYVFDINRNIPTTWSWALGNNFKTTFLWLDVVFHQGVHCIKISVTVDWLVGWMDRMNVDGEMNRQMNHWIDWWMVDWCVNWLVELDRSDSWMDAWIDKWMNNWIDGWIDVLTGWVSGIEGQLEECVDE